MQAKKAQLEDYMNMPIGDLPAESWSWGLYRSDHLCRSDEGAVHGQGARQMNFIDILSIKSKDATSSFWPYCVLAPSSDAPLLERVNWLNRSPLLRRLEETH